MAGECPFRSNMLIAVEQSAGEACFLIGISEERGLVGLLVITTDLIFFSQLMRHFSQSWYYNIVVLLIQ